jgi:3-oxoacyl-[acyl-carrier-protein] synthase-1
MSASDPILITGTGVVCALGRESQEVWEKVRAGESALGPIRQWDVSGWPRRVAAEIDAQPTSLVTDRKLHKLIRRTDVFGIYAAGRAIDQAGIVPWRENLDEAGQVAASEGIGCYVGSGGGTYESQYDYFPLLDSAQGSLETFGRLLGETVNPMWLLRTLPNNVLCHVGIRYGLKGSNACITNHSVSGMLAALEACAAMRSGEAQRCVAIGHDAPIQQQAMLYYHGAGLIAQDTVRPFDARRDGSLFGEGAGALFLETEAAAAARGATVLGELLGGGSGSDAVGLLAIREDGDGLARAIEAAFADAGIGPREVGVVVAHANGTPQSDASEAAALRRVFGASIPPVTGFKWAIGHTVAAAGVIEATLALHALGEGVVPGVPTLEQIDPALADLPVSAKAQATRGDVALILCRGFGGTNAALLVRARR